MHRRVTAILVLVLAVLPLLLLRFEVEGARKFPGEATQQWGEPLPPCSSTPGGISGWDCYDPPTEPLPPCDFNHQRAGVDCWPSPPPTAKPDAKMDRNTSLSDGVSGDAPGSPSKGHHEIPTQSVHSQQLKPDSNQEPGNTGGDAQGSPSKGHHVFPSAQGGDVDGATEIQT